MHKLLILFLFPLTLINNAQATCWSRDGGSGCTNSSYVFSISAGPEWQSGVQSQTINLTPTIEKFYTATQSSQAMAYASFFLGVEKGLSEEFSGQLGVETGATGFAQVRGVIWDDADPIFDNYAYQYSLQHGHIALKGKLLANMSELFAPWVSASMGVGFNKTSSFSNAPLIYEAVVTPNFADNTSYGFTYSLGLGVQIPIKESIQLGVGYEFAQWGKSQLGLAPGQTTSNSLVQNNIYTNGILVNATFYL